MTTAWEKTTLALEPRLERDPIPLHPSQGPHHGQGQESSRTTHPEGNEIAAELTETAPAGVDDLNNASLGGDRIQA